MILHYLYLKFFDQNSETNRVLILISDGEDHDDIPNDLIDLISTNNISLITIGMGEEIGSTIPLRLNGVIDSYKKDRNGDVVITKRNSLILNKIADSSDGDYIDGNFTDEALEQVKLILDEIDKSEFEHLNLLITSNNFKYFYFCLCYL